jgi:hypothetical protein
LLHGSCIRWLPSALGIFCLIYHVIWFKLRVLFCQIIHWRASEAFCCVLDKWKSLVVHLVLFWKTLLELWKKNVSHTPVALQINLLKYFGCSLFYVKSHGNIQMVIIEITPCDEYHFLDWIIGFEEKSCFHS